MQTALVRGYCYVGLAIAGFLVIVSLSGSLIVFWTEIESLFNPGLFHVQSHDRSMFGFVEVAWATTR
ncbi:PepSY-associated TM helix domain-containing protein [Sphingomonadaceae bacterium jetA1]|jgi:uncharacterized iron-regulated membrane protein|uniref:PepSY domain-containing protein n=1 Tax=Facivitalis istanbulensis TaxID=3075838 RepID=UPI0034765D78